MPNDRAFPRPWRESDSILINHIAMELRDAEPILSAIRREAQAKSAADPAPAASRPPETEVEVALHEIWTELLGVRECRADDDFFALGGRSLLAVQMFSCIQERFGIELPLDAVFNESLTIATIAARIAPSVDLQKGSGE